MFLFRHLIHPFLQILIFNISLLTAKYCCSMFKFQSFMSLTVLNYFPLLVDSKGIHPIVFPVQIYFAATPNNHQYFAIGGEMVVQLAHYHQTLSAILCLISARESRRHCTQTIMVATGTGVGIRPSFVSFVGCHRFSSLHLLHF